MLTREMNARLSLVGAGTPAGELLRRYWWPIAAVAELDVEPVLAVTLLGENLALYRTEVLLEQIERVERGEDPMGVIRDSSRNAPFLSVPRERNAFFTHAGGMVATPEAYAEDPLAIQPPIRVR
ncbi:MAG TPA: hypothetical protein VGK33_22235 [Chloroflexota bacterium]